MAHINPVENFDKTDPASLKIGLAVLGIVVGLAVVIIFSFYYYQGVISAEQDRQEITETSLALKKIRSYETEMLNGVAWVDKKKNIVKIPIDFAMEQVIQEYRKK